MVCKLKHTSQLAIFLIRSQKLLTGWGVATSLFANRRFEV